MRAISILEWILRIAGLCALLLGLTYWIAHVNVLNIHQFFGLLVALTLLTISILAILTRELRILGLIGVVYAIILPIFGMKQATLLIGNLHWIIQVLHMLVGIGALALAGIMASRYTRLKRSAVKEVPAKDLVH